MPILTATDITKSYGVETIIENVSFHVNAGDKIGIVGVNGAGKTTLLEILSGDLRPDSGSVFMSGDVTLGYLKQQDDFDDESTLLDETKKIYAKFERMESDLSELSQRIAEDAAAQEAQGGSAQQEAQGGSPEGQETQKEGSAEGAAEREALLKRYGDLQERFHDEGGFSYKSEMRGILSSMAFGEEYFDKKIGTLSGGERTRLALACLLMRKPDLLLLDEPTNHLDIGMLKWLEQYLRSYKGAVIIVSHDRYFLDQMTGRIFEIENRRLTCYEGNYTAFAEKKRNRREADLRAYSKQQDEIKRQEEIIRKFKERGTEHLAKRAASREKKLEAMDILERPDQLPGTMKITFHQRYKSGNDVFLAEGLSREYVDTGAWMDNGDAQKEPGAPAARIKEVFSNIDLDIKRGERICIVGANGIGKTTLLKILSGELEPTSGYLRKGVNVDIGYYDQRQEKLDPEKTVMDEIHDDFRLYKDSEIRSFLGRFMFKGDSVFSKVGDLSGGEKARLALLKLMMAGTNVLLLDEPTNHLDIDSKEVFEEALSAYPGTVIAVSHDRYFLNKIADKIYELTRDGIVKYEGGYDYYEEKKAEISSAGKYIKELRGAFDGAPSKSGGSGAPGKAEAPGFDQAGQAGSSEERRMKKKIEAEERRKKRRHDELEKEIQKLESHIEETEKEMCLPENIADHKKLAELEKELKEAKEKLDSDYEEWMELDLN